MGLNVGVISGSMVISSVAVVAHSPTSGVKVKVKVPAVDISMVGGDQVPGMPSIEVPGSTGAASF